MEQAKKVLAEKTAILNGYGKKIPPVQDLAKAIGVNEGTVVAGFLFIVAVILMLFNGFAILLTSIAVVYPGLQSIRAIESPAAHDDKYWLTYWMVFGTLSVAETFLPFVFYLIPYWDYVKLGLFVWLVKFNGSQIIFESVIQQALRDYKPMINEFMKKIQGSMYDVEMKAKAAMMDPQNLMKAAAVAQQVQQKVNEAVHEEP